MAINPNINTGLMIAAPMLQDYFVDNLNGTAMSAGVITCYRDNSRTTLKNWFYMTGTAGNYTFLPLANPLTLSAVGTITDPAGNDCIPFYYPYDENDASVQQPYYITGVDSIGQAQWSRQNFPFLTQEDIPDATVTTLRNYIVNNTYWRNVGTLTATGTADVPFNALIAPSQHDGFANNHDIRFLKDQGGAVDTISFTPMTAILPGTATTPETQLTWTCSTGLTGQAQKCVQYPLSLHVNTLANVQTATVVFYAQCPGSTAQVSLFLYQFLGTGAIAQPAPVLLETFNVNNNYEPFTHTFEFGPVIAAADLGPGGDDAYFIQIGMPLDVATTVNHTAPQFYLSANVPTNNFDTYDEVNSIISSPRTGDFRISLNNFTPYGWVVMNDQTIGSAASPATTRANIDTWPLYNLLWTNVGVSFAPMADGNPYGASAIADFSANRAITLTKTLGRAISNIGTPAFVGGTNYVLGQVAGSQTQSLSIANMPAHNHPGSNVPTGASAGTQSALEGTAPTGSVPAAIASQGSGTAFSIQPPMSFNNMFVKL
jgi:hypothetical protein